MVLHTLLTQQPTMADDDALRVLLGGWSPPLHGNPQWMNPESPAVLAFAPKAKTPAFSHGKGAKEEEHHEENKVMRADGRLILKAIKWADKTYVIPPCPAPNDTPNNKQAAVSNALATIRAGPGSWQDKCGLLKYHFKADLVMTDATMRINPFKDPTSPCFRYEFSSITDGEFNNIVVPANEDDDFRNLSRYASFQMTVQPSIVDPVHPLPADVKVEADSRRIYLQLPTELVPVAPPAAGQPPGEETKLHNGLTVQNIKNFNAIQAVAILCNTPIQLGFYKDGYIEIDKFREWRDKIYHNLLFEHMCVLLKPFIIGRATVQDNAQRIRDCRQKYTDEMGREITKTLQEHYETFSRLINELPQEQPYPLRIAETFFHSLTAKMKQQLELLRYNPPMGAMNNQQQLDSLKIIRDAANEAEKQLRASLETVQTILNMNTAQRRLTESNAFAMQASPRAGSSPQILMTYPAASRASQDDDVIMGFGTPATMGTFYNTPSYYSFDTTMQANTAYQTPPASIPIDIARQSQLVAMPAIPVLFSQTIATQCFFSEDNVVDNMNCIIMLSTAEEAMRKASGMNAPTECWGCAGVEKYKNDPSRFHRFANCPRKEQPDIKEAAFKKINEIRQEWRAAKSRRDDESKGTIIRQKSFLTDLKKTGKCSDSPMLNRHNLSNL